VNPALIVVMGVTGSGKTTVGRALATRLAVEYADADDFHPPANIAKMANGQPLDDEDRRPWLAAVAAWLADHLDSGGVASCSALHRRYRDRLRADAPGAAFLHLAGPPRLVTPRVAAREDHFMPASLVLSQYESLEPLASDELGLTLPLDLPVDRLVSDTVQWLHDRHPS
jgi:gluconokinase